MQNSSEAIPQSNEAENFADVNWDDLGFTLTPTDCMYVANVLEKRIFLEEPSHPLGISESAHVLQFFNMDRKEDGGILLFRPEQNALRMQMGAERMCMKAPSVEQFVDAIKQTVLANKRWIPPPGKGSLYIRPTLMGSGPTLAVAASLDYTFLVFASPVGNYHKVEAAINLIVEDRFHRAAPGGTGGVKAIGNYSPSIKALCQAKARGFADVVFLDSVTGKFIKEPSGCNIFMLKGNVLSTPEINGNILPGITRKSIIELAKSFGYQVEERGILVDELSDADEVLCTGTAVVVTSVATITYKDKRFEYKTGKETVSRKLREALTGIQNGSIEDKMRWTIEI